MLVRFWMTDDPITIAEDETLGQAYHLMRRARIRRLPVLLEGKLTGIVSLSDLHASICPAELERLQATSIASEEWSTRPAREVMTRNPVICAPDSPLETAAAVLRDYKVGALPVVRSGKLVGIVTESDLFRAFTELMHMGDGGRRICFQVPRAEKGSIFARVFELTRRHGIELSVILTHALEGSDKDLVTLRVRGREVDALVDALWDLRYQVMRVGG